MYNNAARVCVSIHQGLITSWPATTSRYPLSVSSELIITNLQVRLWPRTSHTPSPWSEETVTCQWKNPKGDQLLVGFEPVPAKGTNTYLAP